MTDKEKKYLENRLQELFQKKLQLNLEMRRTDREIANITKKLEKEIITNE